jgi:hypothetical protein
MSFAGAACALAISTTGEPTIWPSGSREPFAPKPRGMPAGPGIAGFMSPGALLSPCSGSGLCAARPIVAPHVTQERYPGGFGDSQFGQVLSGSSAGASAIGGPNEKTRASGRPRWALPPRAGIGIAGCAGGV